MAKFLFQGSYSEQGLKGIIKDGGTARRQVVRALIESLGGTLEMFYFAHGKDDILVVADVPDAINAIATSLIINASGAVKVRTTVLITPEEIDQATRVTVNYRPPGQ